MLDPQFASWIITFNALKDLKAKQHEVPVETVPLKLRKNIQSVGFEFSGIADSRYAEESFPRQKKSDKEMLYEYI